MVVMSRKLRTNKKGELYTITDIPAFKNSIDSFGNLISRNTTNEADIGAEYPFSPERLRLYEDNQRVFVQYGENPTNTEGNTILNDAVDSWFLRPSQGSVVKFTTAERFRYIVGYVIVPSFAFAINKQLNEGDKIVIGFGEADLENDMANADGWFFIYTPDLKANTIRISEYRLGEEVATQVIEINKAINIWKRMAIRVNWYNVGADFFQETYSDRGKQYNPLIGGLDVGDAKGPSSANKRVEFAIKRGVSSPPIELEIGSIGVETLGDVGVIQRQKISQHSYTFSTTGSWVPILAFRTKPGFENVFSELEEIIITDWGGNSDVTLAAQAISPEKVQDSGGNPLVDSDYQSFLEHSGINTALEFTTNIAQAPDSNGTIQTSIAESTGVGGYQVGFSTYNTSQQGQNKQATSRFIKRAVHDTDVIVIFGLAPTASEIKYLLVTEQDW